MTIKPALFGMLLCVAGSVHSSESVFITDSGVKIPVDNISALIAADDSSTFTVMLKEGDPVYDVSRLTKDLTVGVGSLHTSTDAIPSMMTVSGILTIDNCEEQAMIAVSRLDGVIMIKETASGGSYRLDISSLDNGVYILTVGSRSIKFVKP